MTLFEWLAATPLPPVVTEAMRGYCNGLVILLSAIEGLAETGVFGDNEALVGHVLTLGLDTLARQWITEGSCS